MSRIPIWARATAIVGLVLVAVFLGTTLLSASGVDGGQGSATGMRGMDHGQRAPGGHAGRGTKTMDHAAGQSGDHSSAQHGRDGEPDGR